MLPMASLPLDLPPDLAEGWMFGDLDSSDILLEYAQILQPPYLVAGVGLAIGVLCGLTFAKLVQDRLRAGNRTASLCCRWAMSPLPCLI